MKRHGGSQRSRISVDVPPALRRRIRVAAAERDLSMREYVASILEAAVPSERPAGGAYRRGRVITESLIERFREIQRETMAGRTFDVDSAELIEEGRTERTEDL
jgi:hypothetical protein